MDRTDRVITTIMGAPADVLGPYYFRHARIELHWFAIWLVANDLGVSVEDLTKVTLIHYMAHFYTQVGHDARTNGALTRTSVMIIEGVAQYYTHEVLASPEADDNPGPLAAIMKPPEHQPAPPASGS